MNAATIQQRAKLFYSWRALSLFVCKPGTKYRFMDLKKLIEKRSTGLKVEKGYVLQERELHVSLELKSRSLFA